jgi:hypothetical protein
VVLELGAHAPLEQRALARQARARAKASATSAATVTSAAAQVTSRAAPPWTPLSASERIKRFLVEAVPLPLRTPARLAALTKLLEKANWVERDAAVAPAIARVLAAWAHAEVQPAPPTRMVISGESSGSNFIDGRNGSLHMDDLVVLAEQFPRAAGAIEDVAVSACNTGYAPQVGLYRSIFRNLKTLLAYVDEAPSAASGSITHLTRWEHATVGTAERLNRELFQTSRKGDNVMTWSKTEGVRYSSKFDELSRSHQFLTAHHLDPEHPGFGMFGEFREELLPVALRRYFRGELRVQNPDEGPLREYYRSLQHAYQLAPPGWTKERLRRLKELTLRVLHYPKVSKAFARIHSEELTTLYAHLKLNAPDFTKLSRTEAYRALAQLKQAVERSNLRADISSANRPAREAFETVWSGLGELNELETPGADWL